MGAKSGPCTHCGITATPLWRRGPPEKPILCNACGSRWRHRGTLAGYMPMQVTGLSTCHVPTGFVASDEPVIPRVKSAGSLKRKERSERVGQESERGLSDRLRERREKDGYETDGSEASLSGQAARRKMSPSCSPNSVLPPPPRVRAPPSRTNHAWSQATALLSDLHAFDLDLSDVLTSEEPFAGLDDDVTLFGARQGDPPAAEQPLKSLDAGQYICGLVVRTRVEALAGPGARTSSTPINHVAEPHSLSSKVDAQAQNSMPLFPSSARFTLPSRHAPPAPAAQVSWPPAAPGLAQLNIAKLQGSDFGNGSPHRASFPDNLLFKGAAGPESLNDFMARTEGDKRFGELAGAHGMPGSHDSLDSGASLVLDETREHPMVDLNPPPEQQLPLPGGEYKPLLSPPAPELPLCGGEKGEKDLRELHRMFSAPIWDSLDMDPHGAEKEFGLGRFSVPPAEAGRPV